MIARFLKYCILFTLPLLLGAVALEYTVRQVPNPYRCKYDWMEQHAEQVEVLLLGSSHIFYGVKPDLFPQTAFNLGNVSQEIEQDIWLLKHWAPRYQHLKTVILTMSTCFWFNKGLENGDEAFRCCNYKIYMHCDLYPDLPEYNLEIAHWPQAKQKLKNFNMGCDRYGWGNIYTLAEKDMDDWNNMRGAAITAKRHTPDNWDSVNKNMNLMRQLADFCRQHGIRLVLITTPTWHTYYERIATNQLQKMHQLIHHLQQEYGISYLDYLKDTRFTDDDFFDCDHLSDKGAEKFTKILLHDLNTLPLFVQ